jgi:hypothetical protein
MKEREKINEILANLSPSERLFRINAGTGWQGKIIEHSRSIIVLANPRPLHAAPKDWPDLCGWETIEITPEMVGQKIAVFKGVEVKISGRLTPGQRKFGELIERMGGIFQVIRD